MKKLLTITTIFLGLFLFTGIVSASTADLLQPASTITYNEDLTVNGTARFDSVYIGKQDVGGVTFFNGTIINSTTGDGDSDNPVTFGDGVRIDGLIWGGPSKGNASDQALKIGDTLLPGLTNVNDIGSSSLRWKKLYAKDADISGNLTLDGDIFQNKNSNGALKAAAYCKKTISVSNWHEAEYYFNNLNQKNSKVYCFRSANQFDKHFEVRFGEDGESSEYNMKNRFIQTQSVSTVIPPVNINAVPRKLLSDSNVVEVDTYSNNTRDYEDFIIYVY